MTLPFLQVLWITLTLTLVYQSSQRQPQRIWHSWVVWGTTSPHFMGRIPVTSCPFPNLGQLSQHLYFAVCKWGSLQPTLWVWSNLSWAEQKSPSQPTSFQGHLSFTSSSPGTHYYLNFCQHSSIFCLSVYYFVVFNLAVAKRCLWSQLNHPQPSLMLCIHVLHSGVGKPISAPLVQYFLTHSVAQAANSSQWGRKRIQHYKHF